MSLLKIEAIGNLGKDATQNTVEGKTVFNFSIAHTEKWADKERTTWIECAYWTEKTGLFPFLKKGQQVYVEGTPLVRVYDKKEGGQGFSLTCRVGRVVLCGSAKEGGAAAGGGGEYVSGATAVKAATPAPGEYKVGEGELIDDLPF